MVDSAILWEWPVLDGTDGLDNSIFETVPPTLNRSARFSRLGCNLSVYDLHPMCLTC